jgi:Superinfection immunity protein
LPCAGRIFGAAALIASPAWAASSRAADDGGVIMTVLFFIYVVLFLGVVVLFLLPTIIAFHRGHPNRVAILLINLLVGWTGLGWIGVLVWSVTSIASPERIIYVDRSPHEGTGLVSWSPISHAKHRRR